MTRPARPTRILLALTSLLLLVGIAGCMESPTAPENPAGQTVTAPEQGPAILQVNPDGSTAWVTIPTALQVTMPGTFAEAEFDPTRRLSVQRVVDGSAGSRLVCGRFVATVPAGAFEGVGTITMTMPDTTLMLCELEVTPAELNNFAVPVELSLRTTGTTTDLDSLEVYWWDPAKSEWKAMGCQRSDTLEPVLAEEMVTAQPIKGATLPLSHFSKYAAGKAGW